MSRPNVIRVAIVIAMMIAAALALVAWIAPSLREHRMRYWHFTWLEYGVQKYKLSHGVFPTNIEQLVADKILPPKSEIYACPLTMRSPLPLFPMARDFRNSDYTLINSNELLYIQVRSNVAARIIARYPELTTADLTHWTLFGNDGPQIGNGDGTPATPPGKW